MSNNNFDILIPRLGLQKKLFLDKDIPTAIFTDITPKEEEINNANIKNSNNRKSNKKPNSKTENGDNTGDINNMILSTPNAADAVSMVQQPKVTKDQKVRQLSMQFIHSIFLLLYFCGPSCLLRSLTVLSVLLLACVFVRVLFC